MKGRESMSRIYHYTKINILELMLKNSTIRLNALKNMDDLLEGRSRDDFDFSRYYYASSWTVCGEESIPMWSMYTDGMKGVRIEANDDFLNVDEDIKDYHIKNCVDNDVLAFKIYSKDDDGFLVPVEYMEEKPKFLTGHPRGYIAEENYKIGRVKPKVWAFQKEIRFLLQGISINNIAKFGDTLFDRFMNATINQYRNDLEFIDLKFDLSKWKDANFVLGPNTSDDNLEKVENMLLKYIKGFNGYVKRSDLQIRF